MALGKPVFSIPTNSFESPYHNVVNRPVHECRPDMINIGPTSPDSEAPEKMAVATPVPSRMPANSTLTPSQSLFVREFATRRNLLLTGEAGTGKSYLLKVLFEDCEKRRVNMAKTASTGIAALNIGGQTIHSWAGLGLGDEEVGVLIAKIRKNKKAVARMNATDVLVLDEVSMIKADLLDKLDVVLKYFRYNNRPFGGVQLICCGDFLQLPPIWRGGETKDFAFNSRSWREANVKVVELKEKMRQDASTPFAELLSRLRVGDASDLSLLSSRVGATFPASEVEPIRIFCKNVDVNQFNRQRLMALKGELKTFRSTDFGQPHHIDYFEKNCPAPTLLELKIGAQVMLLSNLDVKGGLVNGSMGVVKSFGPNGIDVAFTSGRALIEEDQWEIKEQVVGLDKSLKYKVVATRTQFPLKLAYATTVHKSQGQTLDRAVLDLSEAFTDGQAYTSLSRVRRLEDLSLVEFPPSVVRANPVCLKFYENLV